MEQVEKEINPTCYIYICVCVCVCVYVCLCVCCAQVLQLCLTLCDPMDCNLPGSSVHGILQVRILEWVVMFFSRGSSQCKDQTQVSYVYCTGRWVLYHPEPPVKQATRRSSSKEF